MNGKAQMTESGINLKKTDPNFALNTGAGKYANFEGYYELSKGPSGQYIDLMQEPDVLISNHTPIEKDFCAHYNVKYPTEVLETLWEAGWTQAAFCPVFDTLQIEDR